MAKEPDRPLGRWTLIECLVWLLARGEITGQRANPAGKVVYCFTFGSRTIAPARATADSPLVALKKLVAKVKENEKS